jgi:hypothetical protein
VLASGHMGVSVHSKRRKRNVRARAKLGNTAFRCSVHGGILSSPLVEPWLRKQQELINANLPKAEEIVPVKVRAVHRKAVAQAQGLLARVIRSALVLLVAISTQLVQRMHDALLASVVLGTFVFAIVQLLTCLRWRWMRPRRRRNALGAGCASP